MPDNVMGVLQWGSLVAAVSMHEFASWRYRDSLRSGGRGLVHMMERSDIQTFKMAALGFLAVMLGMKIPPALDVRYEQDLGTLVFGVAVAFTGVLVKMGADAAKIPFYFPDGESVKARANLGIRSGMIGISCAAAPALSLFIASGR